MAQRHRLLLLGTCLLVANPTSACEPVLPFIQAMLPTLTLSHSIFVLGLAVALKSALFALFERRLPRLRAAWVMFLGNVFTSFIGLLITGMIANPNFWFVGVPMACLLCWLPSRRLVEAAPLTWLARRSPAVLAVAMTGALAVSCILFGIGQESVLQTHRYALYWTMKLAAIFLALLSSVTLTVIWEEWAIWLLSSRPAPGFFPTVLRANLYVLLLVMLVPAVLILPKRLHSPDFLAQKHNVVVSQTIAPRP